MQQLLSCKFQSETRECFANLNIQNQEAGSGNEIYNDLRVFTMTMLIFLYNDNDNHATQAPMNT